MRERSQQKGKDYVDNVKRWLVERPLLGLMPKLFGYSYDASQRATKIGEEYFDFSLKLYEGEICKKILYVECKYRDERKGININNEFKQFVKKVYTALKKCKGTEEYNDSEFIFIATIPPDDWRKFLNKKSKYFYDICDSCKDSDPEVIEHLANILHVLVLSNRIIGGG